MVTALHHVSVIVSDTKQALLFYRDILGLPVDPARPDLGYPGAWLSIGVQQIHLLELPNPDSVTGRPEHAGRDRHMALLVPSLDEVMSEMEKNRVAFTLSKSGRRALFCRDPDGNGVELIEG